MVSPPSNPQGIVNGYIVDTGNGNGKGNNGKAVAKLMDGDRHYPLPCDLSMPSLLSNKYRKNITLKHRLGSNFGNIPQLPSLVRGPNGTPIPGGHSHPGATIGGVTGPGGGVTDAKIGDDSKNGNADLSNDGAYQPFPLSDGSSFSPNKISRRQFTLLDPLTRAKYLAYQKPPPECAQLIVDADKRSKMWEREERRNLQIVADTMWKRWEKRKFGVKHGEDSKVGEDYAKKASERTRGKVAKALEMREAELQFLVEGQQNSIEAIRLKEYLSQKRDKIKIGTLFTDKERQRVEELLAE